MFGFAVVASSLHDPSLVESAAADSVASLEALGGRRGDEDPSQVWLVATGGTEAALMRRWAESGPHVPRLLVAHPGHNSLPAALETMARIRQLGGRGAIAVLDGPDDEEGLAAVGERLADLAAWRRLHGLRIGSIGGPSDWLVASSPSPDLVRSVWGPEVVTVPIGDLVQRHRPDRGAEAPGPGRPRREVVAAAGVTAGLRALAAEHDVGALTVRCFDLIGSLGTTGCLALSALNDEGTVAGCEGDLVSAVGMLWVQAVTGSVPWMANPARVRRGEVVLAHCTVPTEMVDEVRLDTHFESGVGVGIAGRFPPGPVTLLRIGGADLTSLWVAEGELIPAGRDPRLCRTQATVRVDDEEAAALLEEPLGNHLVMAAGHHGAALRRYHGWLIRPTS